MPRKIEAPGNRSATPLRVIKTVLPVPLIREMDQLILAAGGAYAGRDEFITEAIRDRIAEDRARGGPAPGGESNVVLLPVASERVPDLVLTAPTDAPTFEPVEGDDLLYGLHNRDFPTLWALGVMARMSAKGQAPTWRDFVTTTLEQAWSVGAHLEQLDRERSRSAFKAAIGFPTNPEKRESAESRFLEHMLGSIRDSRARGPLFALGLAGIRQQKNARGAIETHAAPTPAGFSLLRELAAAEIGPRPPHSEAAWRAFCTHMRAHAKRDFAKWVRVLRDSAGKGRDEVVAVFAAEWPGSAASTNVYGYVSRGREWGLVEPDLIDGKYMLTERGEQLVQEMR